MRGDEARVVSAFCAYLESAGWSVETEVDGCDVVARRDEETLYAEAKGRTAAAGLDIDTMYGQLLRRMTAPPGLRNRYAVVVPDSLARLVTRVPKEVRERLAIDVFLVSEDNEVRSA